MDSYEEVEKRIEKNLEEDLIISYSIDKEYYIILNGNVNKREIDVENGKYLVLIRGNKVSKEGLEAIEIKNGKIVIDGISVLLLKKLVF